MEGREKKNYTEVLEENDRRNVFNLKCCAGGKKKKIHSSRTLQWLRLLYSLAPQSDVATAICHRNEAVSMQMTIPE